MQTHGTRPPGTAMCLATRGSPCVYMLGQQTADRQATSRTILFHKCLLLAVADTKRVTGSRARLVTRTLTNTHDASALGQSRQALSGTCGQEPDACCVAHQHLTCITELPGVTWLALPNGCWEILGQRVPASTHRHAAVRWTHTSEWCVDVRPPPAYGLPAIHDPFRQAVHQDCYGASEFNLAHSNTRAPVHNAPLPGSAPRLALLILCCTPFTLYVHGPSTYSIRIVRCSNRLTDALHSCCRARPQLQLLAQPSPLAWCNNRRLHIAIVLLAPTLCSVFGRWEPPHKSPATCLQGERAGTEEASGQRKNVAVGLYGWRLVGIHNQHVAMYANAKRLRPRAAAGLCSLHSWSGFKVGHWPRREQRLLNLHPHVVNSLRGSCGCSTGARMAAVITPPGAFPSSGSLPPLPLSPAPQAPCRPSPPTLCPAEGCTAASTWRSSPSCRCRASCCFWCCASSCCTASA